ncbi:MAG: class II aldolase/adducin family protein [candidate division Zixibacteria bacterium]|nr:class II aldolase/adducin family protein [candidate division Zixibacteria bacterium]
MPDIDSLRSQLTEFCQRLYDRDLVGSTEGNASVKIDLHRFLITPTGSNLGYLEQDDPVILSMEGKQLTGDKAPSSEYHLHLGIYQHRWDIQAICHAHPIAATACATAGVALDQPILPEIISTFGIIPLVDYGTPGTPELFEKMVDLVGRYDAFLLKSHGVVTLGANLDEAFNRMEMVERCARVIITANLIGNIRQLPEEIVQKLPGFEVLNGQFQTGNSGKD